MKLVLKQACGDAICRILLFGILGLASLLILKGCNDAASRLPIGRDTTGGVADDGHREIRRTVDRMKTRTDPIRALKASGKVMGSEHGLLNPADAAALSVHEQRLLDQENDDRRRLYLYIAEHSDPSVTYEQVANEYAMKRWKEWPPK